MELLEGESLAARLRKVGRLSPEDTARILTHTARAVSRAHEVGVVHRDLKPDNIFLIENEEEELAKVLDFGIAKSTIVGFGMSAVAETRTGALMGTLHYMSPEQAEGVKSVDFRTDIWAMGVIAFECLLGRRPFEGETVGTLVLELCSRPLPIPSQVGAVPAGFDAWFARVCARDPAERFASARDVAAELRRICQARGIAPEDAEGARTKLVPPAGPRLNGKVLGLGIAAGVAVVGALVFAFGRSGESAPAPAAVAAPAPLPAVAPPPKPVPVPAAAAPEPVAPAPAPVAVEPPPPPAAVAAKPAPAAERPRRRAEKAPSAKPASRPAAVADPKPAPARPPAATPAEKPKINLGI